MAISRASCGFSRSTARALPAELKRRLDKLKTGQCAHARLSPSLVKMLSEAWTVGSLDFGAAQIRTGFTLLALVTSDELVRLMREVSKEFQQMQGEALRKDFLAIVAGSVEDASNRWRRRRRRGPRRRRPGPGGGKTPNLDQYTVNLTENAKAGKIDPVLGRDHEIRQVVDILMRRRQNNPILTGEAGVGKTAVVEGFALRLAAGDVPPPLRNVTLRSLDLALLQAGAGVKGEFENRLKGLIEEVKSSPMPIILFIDEAHTMIGAGGQAGPERRGQSAEAGAGARRTAHHRRHHLVGVQEILREGRGPGAALPGGEGGGADRDAVRRDAARHCAVAREASQRAHPR